MSDRDTWRIKFHVAGRCALVSKGELSKGDAVRSARLSARGLRADHPDDLITAHIQLETAPGIWSTKKRLTLHKPKRRRK